MKILHTFSTIFYKPDLVLRLPKIWFQSLIDILDFYIKYICVYMYDVYMYMCMHEKNKISRKGNLRSNLRSKSRLWSVGNICDISKNEDVALVSEFNFNYFTYAIHVKYMSTKSKVFRAKNNILTETLINSCLKP